jgi:hypothetical protein
VTRFRIDGKLQALRKLASVSREMITRNPAFIAGQVLLDVSGAMVRESAWEGGPPNTPKVLKALMQTYFDPELWKGLDSGQYKGDYARFLREGGGMAGFQDMTQEGASSETGRPSCGTTRLTGFRSITKKIGGG